MTKPNVLISGASVAGPALAYFLHHAGYDVTVVERAPALRDTGYAVDFRGPALDVLKELGILTELREHDTRMGGTTIVDEAGNEVVQLPAEAFGGELDVPKRDLTRILHRLTADDVEYLFDDSITALTDHGPGVTVEFEHHPAREFDLVIGADGVHSNVRRLAFGPDGDALRHLGMSGAGFSTANHLGLDRRGLMMPGKASILLFSTGPTEPLTVSLSFATASPALDRLTRTEQEQALRDAFAGYGWEAPRLLTAMSEADDFYFASSCQVHLDHWHRGRVALIGDAGYCAAPTSGMGTSQALVGAWTLARELSAAGGRHEIAYTAYEERLRPYVLENQAAGRQAAASFSGGEAPPAIS
ncbi:FAD-dependent monooxygenase [Actinoplanes utahensis]|uniref:FAD-dependent oxidoreductase n=1 Tax=Actinoplanes utahensis TaxID=1869 RepID=A0A0A6US74_ACTUT|nr:FAD-dependent monooxygenase [Actinoplanes utahensis]KHD77833.1 FAD-dependent oxidoreductase [Actinoplanes utahensis]GIF32494.1 FAD-dependent oxidoreductase [Actinoplanes utahensis]